MSRPTLHCRREGHGPLVVLSHALGLNLHLWDEVAPLLARDHTVLRYDHRNHGGSPTVPGPWDIEVLADDAATLIEQQAGGQPVHFVGISMGGMAAQALAARRPELLASVTVVCSSAHLPDQAPWQARIDAVRTLGMAPIADGAAERWLTPAFLRTERGQAVAARLQAMVAANQPAVYLPACEAVAKVDLRAALPRIRVPALVMAGVLDQSTPPAMSKVIAAAIPGARLAMLETAHLGPAEQPGPFVEHLRSFWRTVPVA